MENAYRLQSDYAKKYKTVFLQCLFLLVLMALLLIGRYDWHNYYAESLRSYFCSLWLAVPLVWVLYGFLLMMNFSFKKAFSWSAVVAVLLSFPHQWLKLRQFYRTHKLWLWGEPGLPSPYEAKLFSAGYFHHSAPFEVLFLLGIFIAGLLLIAYCCRKYDKKVRLFASLFFGLLMVETFLHSSIHSPYCSHASFAVPPMPDGSPRWHVCYLFPEEKGVVTIDYFSFFRDIEIVFQGISHTIRDTTLNRPLPAYLISQFSVFINSYYVMMGLNIMAWAGAALFLFLLIQMLTGDRRCAVFSMVFMCCATGFIGWVSQPSVYVFGYAEIAFIYWLYIYAFVKQRADVLKALVFGGVLGFAFLTYEHFVLVIFCLVFAVTVDKRTFMYTLLSILIAFMLYSGFLIVAKQFGGYLHDPFNENIVKNTLGTIVGEVINKKYGLLYQRLLELFPLFLHNIINAFLFFPAIAAIVALFMLRNNKTLFACFVMLLPAFCNFAFLHFGKHFHLPDGYFKRNVSLSEEPRMLFTAYPAIYFLASYFCIRVFDYLKEKGWSKAAFICAGAVPVFTLILANLDVAGVKAIYLLFYFQKLP
jgi:hypothetical protein